MNQAISQLATWLFPFSEAVHQGLPALLVSHVAIPLLDDENPYLPASVSQKVIQGLIREKWNYQGIIIADDISEYPLDGSETYTDVALRMTGVGIDLICTSLGDVNELTKMVNVIEQNISKEAKEERCMKLAKLVMAVRPLPVKKEEMAPSMEAIPPTEPTTSPVPTETTSIAQGPASVSPETPVEPPKEEITPTSPDSTEQQTSSTAEQSPTTSEASKTPETKVAQDLTQIVTETKPISEEQTTEKNSVAEAPKGETATTKPAEKTPKEETATEKPVSGSKEEKKEELPKSIQKAPQPPGTKAIYHQIARGETLYAIAQRYNVKPKDIMAWNGIDNPNLIKYGSKLIIYVPEGMNVSSTGQKPSSVKRPETAPVSVPTTESEKNSNNIQLQPVEENSKNEETATAASAQEKPSTPSGEMTIYIVKHGDTLDSIARDTHVPKEEIIKLNNLKKPYILPSGRKLKVPRVPKVGFN